MPLQCIPLHHSKPHACAFPQPDEIRQGGVGLEVEGEAAHFDVFERNPFFFGDIGDFELESAVELPVHGAGEGEGMSYEDIFEEGDFFGEAGEALPLAEVVGIEGAPFVEVVAEGPFPGMEVVLLDVEAGDAHVVVMLADAQAPVGLGKEMLSFFDAVVEKQEHRAHLFFEAVNLVLDERVSLVEVVVFVVVVVKPVVFEADFSGDGAAELGQLPGLDGGIESDGQDSEMLHVFR